MTAPAPSSAAIDIAEQLISWSPKDMDDLPPFEPVQHQRLQEVVARTIDALVNRKKMGFDEITLVDIHEILIAAVRQAGTAGVSDVVDVASRIVYTHIIDIAERSPHDPPWKSEFLIRDRLTALADGSLSSAPRRSIRSFEPETSDGDDRLTAWADAVFTGGEPVLALGVIENARVLTDTEHTDPDVLSTLLLRHGGKTVALSAFGQPHFGRTVTPGWRAELSTGRLLITHTDIRSPVFDGVFVAPGDWRAEAIDHLAAFGGVCVVTGPIRNVHQLATAITDGRAVAVRVPLTLGG
ncbi:hypothetical protein ACIP5Y_07605 [Nocardia sp. NPDC088792]|uniref:hypothetical protein n=1 Tax=Nocardia sp. NPDC088792 TaxID=3364332 RepID=UPI0038127317